MAKKILVALVGLVLVLLAVVATRPSSFRLERSARIEAPAEAVYAQVADFHRWERWSPWAKLDPQMKTSYDGPASGPGAVYAWSGNEKVGEGRMTVLGAKPGESVDIRLEFLKPWKSINSTNFTLRRESGGTRVTWAMAGENDFMAKAFSLFMDVDKVVGADFEKGLAQLKAVAEAEAKGAEDASAPAR
jgi:hypothetical protein